MNTTDLLLIKAALAEVAEASEVEGLSGAIDRALGMLLFPSAIKVTIEALRERGLKLEDLENTGVLGIADVVAKLREEAA